MTEHFWTCQRVTRGVKCGWKNSARLRKCAKCRKDRPTVKRAEHLRALDLDYAHYRALNGDVDKCGICGAEGKTRRLHRDHEHRGAGTPRGLLCFPCNRKLPNDATSEWLEKAAEYLRRTENRSDENPSA